MAVSLTRQFKEVTFLESHKNAYQIEENDAKFTHLNKYQVLIKEGEIWSNLFNVTCFIEYVNLR